MSQPNDPFRFRLATLLIGTAMVAFVVYATVQPSVWAASFGFTLAIVVLAVALIRALVSNGVRRRYLLGFSLAGLAYLGTLYLPGVNTQFGAKLITTLEFARVEGTMYERLLSNRDPRWRAMEQRADAKSFVRNWNSSGSLPQETWAARAFHSMFAIVLGVIAGWVAMLPQRGEMKGDTSAGGVVE